MKKKLKIDDKRIAVCEYTKKEIVQIYEGRSQWLCLHNEDEKLDKLEVERFKGR